MDSKDTQFRIFTMTNTNKNDGYGYMVLCMQYPMACAKIFLIIIAQKMRIDDNE